MGGKATLKKHGKAFYRRIAALSAASGRSGRPRKPDGEILPASLKRRKARYSQAIKKTQY